MRFEIRLVTLATSIVSLQLKKLRGEKLRQNIKQFFCKPKTEIKVSESRRFTMNTPTQSQERAYIALLGLAEHFRTTRNVRKSIQCLEAVSWKEIC